MGQVVALPLVAVVTFLQQTASLLARLPGAAVETSGLGAWAGGAYYLAVAGGLAAAHSEGGRRRAAIAAAVLGPLLVTGIEVGVWTHPAPGATVLAVGAGQAVLLIGPSGVVLIDGGPQPATLQSDLGQHLAPWDRHLDALVLTSGATGHVDGLERLPYSVGAVYAPALSPLPGQPPGGQLALRVVGPSHAFCDLAELAPSSQALAAAWLRGTCDAVLVPDQGKQVPDSAFLARPRPSLLLVSDAASTRLGAGFPKAGLERTSQEGNLTVPL